MVVVADQRPVYTYESASTEVSKSARRREWHGRSDKWWEEDGGGRKYGRGKEEEEEGSEEI